MPLVRAPDGEGGDVEQLQHVQVQQVEEHRRAAEHSQGAHHASIVAALEVGQQQQADAQRQRQEQQRRRILGDVEQAHQRLQCGFFHGPGFFAIAVEQAQYHEQRQRRETGATQPLQALLGRIGPAEPRADHIAQGDHPDPRQHRVRRAQAQRVGKLDPAAVMQHRPGDVHRRLRAEVQPIEQVVPGHQRQAQHGQQRSRQPQQHGERQHAQADGPDHLQVDHHGRELKGPGEVDQGELQHYEKQPALEQEGAGRRSAHLLLAIEKRRKPGEQDEYRRAQMRQGAAEEQRRISSGHVHRVADLLMQVEGFANVIEQHEEDDQTAQGVDREQAIGGHERLRIMGVNKRNNITIYRRSAVTDAHILTRPTRHNPSERSAAEKVGKRQNTCHGGPAPCCSTAPFSLPWSWPC